MYWNKINIRLEKYIQIAYDKIARAGQKKVQLRMLSYDKKEAGDGFYFGHRRI